jgi:hypothetical protein
MRLLSFARGAVDADWMTVFNGFHCSYCKRSPLLIIVFRHRPLTGIPNKFLMNLASSFSRKKNIIRHVAVGNRGGTPRLF